MTSRTYHRCPLSIIGAVVLLLTAAACGSEETPASAASAAELSGDESALLEKAKGEPSLTWYSSQDPDRNSAVLDKFLARYPDVEATSFRLASGELANRYSKEHESGVNTAGLITLASEQFMTEGKSEDWFVDITVEDYPDLKEFGEFFTDGVVTTGINPFGIGFNTNVVTDPPKDWKDLLDPAYQGKIILGDPRNVPGYVALGKVWMDEYGKDFLSDIAAQQPIVVDSMVPGMQQLAAGEGSVGLPAVLTTMGPLQSQGAPLDLVMPDVTTGVAFETVIPQDGPSPHTAELLYRFLLTEEGQQAFNGETGVSAIEAPGTYQMPANYVTVSGEEIAAAKDEVLSLLGIQD